MKFLVRVHGHVSEYPARNDGLEKAFAFEYLVVSVAIEGFGHGGYSGLFLLVTLGVLAVFEKFEVFEPRFEVPLLDGKGFLVRILEGVLFVEVEGEIDDEEVFLVAVLSKKPGAKPRAASYHLPKLRFGKNLPREDEVYHLRNVHSRIEHVDADGHAEFLFGFKLLEVFQKFVVLLDVRGYDDRKIPQVRVHLFERVTQMLGVCLVHGENDRLSREPIADFYRLFHEFAHDGPVGIAVVDLLSYFGTLEVVILGVLPFLFELFENVLGKLAALDALYLEPRSRHEDAVRYQITVGYGLVHAVRIGGVAIVATERIVRAAVDELYRRGREADLVAVEMVENGFPFAVDAPVDLVDDHQIEKTARKLFEPLGHGLVRRGKQAGVFVGLVGFDDGFGGALKIHGETVVRGLVAEGGPVRKEKHLLGVVGAEKHVYQSHRGTGFSRTGGHDEKKFPLSGLHAFHYALYRLVLVVPAGNGGIHFRARRRKVDFSKFPKAPQIRKREKRPDFAGRKFFGGVVEEEFAAVGKEDERSVPLFSLDDFSVFQCLKLPVPRASFKLLRFDDGNDGTVRIEQRVVGKEFVYGKLQNDLAGIFDVPAEVSELFVYVGTGLLFEHCSAGLFIF